MTKRFTRSLFAWAVLALILPAPVRAASGSYTLIVAPARYSVLQVAFDLVQRHSAVLVSYQGEATTPEPRLHAWNGQEWVKLSVSDYREVNFLQSPPARTVLIGDQQMLPAVLVEASTWTPEVVHVTGLETSTLVNEFGRLLKFRTAEWKWFAARYNLDLRDDNSEKRANSWYDQPGPLQRDAASGAPAVLTEETPSDVEPVGGEIVITGAEEPDPAPVQSAEEPVVDPAAANLPDADAPAVE
ncbi:MAG TPA: hypothetical protein VIH35_01600 [Kiritimatiellia bacterium]|jgi:hypothetical protein